MHIFGIHIADGQALATGVTRTLMQLVTPASRRARPLEISVSFPSTSPSDAPVRLELHLQGTAGTSSAFTPLPYDQSDPAALCSGRNAFTVEPTDLGLLPGKWNVTPVGGLLVYTFAPTHGDPNIMLQTGTRMGVVAVPTVTLAGVAGYMAYQE